MKPDRREIGVMTQLRIKRQGEHSGWKLQYTRIVSSDNNGYQIEWQDVPEVPHDAPDTEEISRPRTTSANQPPYYY